MGLPSLSINWVLDGVSLNTGDDAHGFSYLVNSDIGWRGSPPPRPDLQPNPTANGAYNGPNYDAPRIVTLDGIAQCRTPQDEDALYDTLAGMCRDPKSIFTLVKNEYTRSLALGVIRTAPCDIRRLPSGMLTWNIQLSAPDGRKYSTNAKSVSTGLSSGNTGGVLWNGTPGNTGVEWNGPGGGTGVPWQQAVGSTGIFSMENDGTAPTPVFFTITAPPTVTLVQPMISTFDGQVIAYAGTMAPNDVLTIDTGTGLAMLNGANVGAVFTQFNLFEIPARTTLVAQFSANGPSSGAILTAQWSDAF